ncbi:hypothetical protein AAG570_007063 [Ranatra chinensis]|uniref:Uncharacterized protein n=1 Tax=Ranatra chinensis TaxID=642074 RepID=A0ABD0XW00_9HEMI
MAYKRRNMPYQNKKQETTEIVKCPLYCSQCPLVYLRINIPTVHETNPIKVILRGPDGVVVSVWDYHAEGLGFDFLREVLSGPRRLDGDSSKMDFEADQSLKEWAKDKPLSILQLDPADRAVLRIAVVGVVGNWVIVSCSEFVGPNRFRLFSIFSGAVWVVAQVTTGIERSAVNTALEADNRIGRYCLGPDITYGCHRTLPNIDGTGVVTLASVSPLKMAIGLNRFGLTNLEKETTDLLQLLAPLLHQCWEFIEDGAEYINAKGRNSVLAEHHSSIPPLTLNSVFPLTDIDYIVKTENAVIISDDRLMYLAVTHKWGVGNDPEVLLPNRFLVFAPRYILSPQGPLMPFTSARYFLLEAAHRCHFPTLNRG